MIDVSTCRPGPGVYGVSGITLTLALGVFVGVVSSANIEQYMGYTMPTNIAPYAVTKPSGIYIHMRLRECF